MVDIIKIVTSHDESKLLVKGFSETIKKNNKKGISSSVIGNISC